MDKQNKRVVKVTATLSDGEVVNYEGQELVIVLGHGENTEAVTVIDGSLPFMMFAHDSICDHIKEQKLELISSLNGNDFMEFMVNEFKKTFEKKVAAAKEGPLQ